MYKRQDLLSIHSLGFRGEALSSIAAVAQVELITKTYEELTGTRYVIEGSKEVENEEIGAPEGTTFIVRNLFYNVPARRKFLKTAQTEAGYISDLMERMALSLSLIHILDPTSNVQFGEGGAGTFSDGKLNTLVKDPVGRSRFVLDTFVSFGAPEKITYESKPHIGTDILSDVIAAMREEILQLGGSFEFESCVTDIRVADQKIKAVEINHNTWMETEVCVLALGHSARDTFEMLHKTCLLYTSRCV